MSSNAELLSTVEVEASGGEGGACGGKLRLRGTSAAIGTLAGGMIEFGFDMTMSSGS